MDPNSYNDQGQGINNEYGLGATPGTYHQLYEQGGNNN